LRIPIRIEFQIRWGKYSPVNPVSNPAAREIAAGPVRAEELPVVFTTRRRREVITLSVSGTTNTGRGTRCFQRSFRKNGGYSGTRQGVVYNGFVETVEICVRSCV
jgi:hypothetical protein